jgi:prolyl oligopeptidase
VPVDRRNRVSASRYYLRPPKEISMNAHALSAFSACCLATASVAQDTPQYDARTFYETVSYFGASFSADESKLLVTSDATGVFNVYAWPVDGGEPTQLTNSTTDAFMGVGWFRNDDRFLYTADQGGNELNHLYVQETDGRTRDLTPGTQLKAQFGGWSDDDTAFYVLTNERDPRHFDVYRYAADDYERQLVFQNDDGYMFGVVSPNERWLVMSKVRNNADDNLYLIDTKSAGPPQLITEHEGNVAHGTQDFTPDSAELLYTSNADGEFQRLWTYNLETGTRRLLEEADWDIMSSRFSRDGKRRVTSINADARTKLRVTSTSTGKRVTLPSIPDGDITNITFSPSGKRMAFYVNGSTSPSNLYVLDTASGAQRKLTSSLNRSIDERHLVTAKVIRYPSFDGLEIPAVLYRPHQASASNPVPALVWVHGGPGGQSRTGYNPVIQYLTNHGYAVLAVNNRGSSGFGKTFYHMDDRKHGDVDLKDCIWARRYLERKGWVDGGRGGAGVRAGGVRRGHRHLRRHQLDPDAGEHPELVDRVPRAPLRGAGRSRDRPRASARDLAAVPRQQDRASPARGAGRQRPAGAQGRERRDRRGGPRQRRARRVHRLRRRGARLPQP